MKNIFLTLFLLLGITASAQYFSDASGKILETDFAPDFWHISYPSDVTAQPNVEFHVGVEAGFQFYKMDTTDFVLGPDYGATGIVYIPDQQWFVEGGAAYTSLYFSDEKTRMTRMQGIIGIKDESVSRLFAGIGIQFFSNFQDKTTFGPLFKVGVVPYRKGKFSVRVNAQLGSTFTKFANANTDTSVNGGGSIQLTYRII